MCAGTGCIYTTYDGGCRKPSCMPCPMSEDDVEAYEAEMDRRYEQQRDERLTEDFSRDFR